PRAPNPQPPPTPPLPASPPGDATAAAYWVLAVFNRIHPSEARPFPTCASVRAWDHPPHAGPPDAIVVRTATDEVDRPELEPSSPRAADAAAPAWRGRDPRARTADRTAGAGAPGSLRRPLVQGRALPSGGPVAAHRGSASRSDRASWDTPRPVSAP